MSTTERLRALLAEATPGPWAWAQYDFGAAGAYRKRTNTLKGARIVLRHEQLYEPADTSALLREPDADLIAAAVNALPALLDVVDELVGMIPEAYCVFGRFETCGDPFCSEARARRDAILARLEGVS